MRDNLELDERVMSQTECRHMKNPLHHDIARPFSRRRNIPYAYYLDSVKLGGGAKYQYAGIKVLYISYLHRPSQDVKSPAYGVVTSKSVVLTDMYKSAPRDSWKAGCNSNISLRVKLPRSVEGGGLEQWLTPLFGTL